MMKKLDDFIKSLESKSFMTPDQIRNIKGGNHYETLEECGRSCQTGEHIGYPDDPPTIESCVWVGDGYKCLDS